VVLLELPGIGANAGTPGIPPLERKGVNQVLREIGLAQSGPCRFPRVEGGPIRDLWLIFYTTPAEVVHYQ
jgi:hypothetical protein